MPLSTQDMLGRLWRGQGDIDKSALCVVPVPPIPEFTRKNAAALDLRLGRWFRTMRRSKVTELQVNDTKGEERISKEHYVRFNDSFVLHPGDFVLGITLEWLRLPADISAYVTGKSSWGRRGLIIETAAGIHPGFTGCLTLELANVGAAPIRLNPGMQICQIFFHHVNNRRDEGTLTQFVGYRKPGLGRAKKDAISEALSQKYFPE